MIKKSVFLGAALALVLGVTGAPAQPPEPYATRAEYETLRDEVARQRADLNRIILMQEQLLAALREMPSRQASDDSLGKLDSLHVRTDALVERIAKLEKRIADPPTAPPKPDRAAAPPQQKTPAANGGKPLPDRCEPVVVARPCRLVDRLRSR